jgi:hypothetical protein
MPMTPPTLKPTSPQNKTEGIKKALRIVERRTGHAPFLDTSRSVVISETGAKPLGFEPLQPPVASIFRKWAGRMNGVMRLMSHL